MSESPFDHVDAAECRPPDERFHADIRLRVGRMQEVSPGVCLTLLKTAGREALLLVSIDDRAIADTLMEDNS